MKTSGQKLKRQMHSAWLYGCYRTVVLKSCSLGANEAVGILSVVSERQLSSNRFKQSRNHWLREPWSTGFAGIGVQTRSLGLAHFLSISRACLALLLGRLSPADARGSWLILNLPGNPSTKSRLPFSASRTSSKAPGWTSPVT